MKSVFVVMTALLILWSASAVSSEEKARSFPDFILNGQVQIQLDDGELGSGQATSISPVRNGIGSFEAATQITPRRLRLKPRVDFSPDLSLMTEFDLEPDEFEFTALKLTGLDLYLRYEFVDGHHLRGGQFKVPFGSEFFGSSVNLTTVERSDVSRQFFQRDIGLGAFGNEGRFEYGFAVVQGQGQNERAVDGVNDVAARLVYEAAPGFRIGASGQLGTYRPEDEGPDLPVRRTGVELHFNTDDWALDAEYILSDGYNLFSRGKTPSRGFYAYSTHRLREELDFVLGYDRFDPDVGSVNSLFADNTQNERDRFTIGLNAYLSRKPVHRVMLNYEIRSELEGPKIDSQGFRLRYQYTW